MNYKRIYDEIIKNRLENPLAENEYGQKHHILPKSIFPDKEKDLDNIIKLSAKEHYICHLLLWKYYQYIGNRNAEIKMLNAFMLMNTKCRFNAGRIIFSSHLYEEAKKQFSIAASERNKGENNPQYGKRGELASCWGRKAEKHPQYGKHWYTDGVNELCVESNKKPLNFKLGRLHRNSEYRWFTDGVNEVRTLISEKPENFYSGRASKSVSVRCKKIRCIESGVIYNSLAQAGKSLKISVSCICQCCKGTKSVAGGFHWEYYYGDQNGKI